MTTQSATLLVALLGVSMNLGATEPISHAQSALAKQWTPSGPAPRVVEYSVPVVTMEQVGPLRGRTQAYRVQIFRDGRAVYHGFRDVATLGEKWYHVHQAEVERLLAELERLGFWEAPDDQYGNPSYLSPIGWLFTVRTGQSSKTIRIDGRWFAMALLRKVEDVAKTDRLRCPYVNFMQEELCAKSAEAMNVRADRYEELVTKRRQETGK